MRILFVYPKFADALWAYENALKYIRKGASSPPLGLLTVAAMLPAEWEKKLVDLNVCQLTDDDILSSDYVFISAMLAQYYSTNQIITRCRRLGIPTVAGGPLFSFHAEKLDLVEPDHRFAGEAEGLIDIFLEDLQENKLKNFYQNENFPDVKKSPIPLWNLVENPDAYAMMTLQFTRGCPYDCEFCDVVALNGHKPRIKGIDQIVQEMDALLQFGWKGHIFICDDNFVGNLRTVREAILPVVIEWMEEHLFPFTFSAAVSIDLAEHPEIIELLAKAGLNRVTIGIESPNLNSLRETKKFHNLQRDLLDSIRKIQNHGLEVQAGFIIGFDHDPPSIFDEQIQFIQSSGIPTAMVSMLFAFPGSRLYNRLRLEKRLSSILITEHAYSAINFEPILGIDKIREGHLHILDSIYSPELYYQRLVTFFKYYRSRKVRNNNFQLTQIFLFLRIIKDLGILDDGRLYFWKIIWFGFKRNIHLLPMIIRLMVTGWNFRRDISSYRKALSVTNTASSASAQIDG